MEGRRAPERAQEVLSARAGRQAPCHGAEKGRSEADVRDADAGDARDAEQEEDEGGTLPAASARDRFGKEPQGKIRPPGRPPEGPPRRASRECRRRSGRRARRRRTRAPRSRRALRPSGFRGTSPRRLSRRRPSARRESPAAAPRRRGTREYRAVPCRRPCGDPSAEIRPTVPEKRQPRFGPRLDRLPGRTLESALPPIRFAVAEWSLARGPFQTQENAMAHAIAPFYAVDDSVGKNATNS